MEQQIVAPITTVMEMFAKVLVKKSKKQNNFINELFSPSFTFDCYEQKEIHEFLIGLYISFLVLQEFRGFFLHLQ